MIHKIKYIKNENSAYLAGIVDGEGTITLTRKNKSQNRRLAITISNNELVLLSWIKKTLGAGVIVTKKSSNKSYLPSFTYQIHNSQAYDLLELIAPYLRGYKRIRASLVLKNYHKLTPRNGEYTASLLDKRKKFIESFFNIKGPSTRCFDLGNF